MAAILIAVILLAGHPGLSLAWNCHPPRTANSSSYGAGRIRPPGASSTTYVRAARAIVDTDEHPYADFPGSSDVYVEIKNTQPGMTYYARIGWTERDINEKRYFTEYNSPGVWRNTFVSAVNTPVAALKVVWNNAPGGGQHQFTFWAGNNYTVMDLYGNPVLNWTPDEGQVGTRTVSRESQIAGRPLNKMEMTTTQAHVNGSWVAFGSAPLIGFATATWANFIDVAGDPTWFRSYDGDC